LDKLVLILDDLLASIDLNFDIFSELLAVFLLLKLLPVPVNLNVLFVTDQHFVFQLGGPLYAFLFFKPTPDIFLVVALQTDLVDHLICLTAHLLEDAVCLVDLLISVVVDLFALDYALLVLH